MNIDNYIVYIIIIISIIYTNYTANKVGKKFYKKRIIDGKVNPKVYDKLFAILPDYSKSKKLKLVADLFVVGMVLYTMYNLGNNDLTLLIKRILVVLFIRGIVINLTILPKEKTCDDSKYHLYNWVAGGCYDKIYSGHFSLGLIASLTAVSHKLISVEMMYIYNIVNAILILVLRNHYTIDIITALFASLCTINYIK